MNLKKLIIIGCIALLSFSIVVGVIWWKNYTKKQAFPFDTQTESTGAVFSPLPEPILQQTKTLADLRKLLPVITQEFEITFDYKENRPVVELFSPHDQAEQAFRTWIDEHQFGLLRGVFLIRARQ